MYSDRHFWIAQTIMEANIINPLGNKHPCSCFCSSRGPCLVQESLLLYDCQSVNRLGVSCVEALQVNQQLLLPRCPGVGSQDTRLHLAFINSLLDVWYFPDVVLELKESFEQKHPRTENTRSSCLTQRKSLFQSHFLREKGLCVQEGFRSRMQCIRKPVNWESEKVLLAFSVLTKLGGGV